MSRSGGRPGALLIAGTGENRSGRRTFENPKWDALGPRAGFAYGMGEKQALRGGYGIYYSGIAFDQFVGQPTLGFSSNMPNTSNGQPPAFYLDNVFPQDRVEHPPFINPAFQLGGSPIAVPPDGLTLPRFENWSITYQRQLTSMMLDVSYIGNRGSRLNHHFQTLGVDANMNDPSVLGLGANVLQSNINSDVARSAGIAVPYPGFNGTVAQALRKYPQYQAIQWRGVPTGRSHYNALELVLERRSREGSRRASGIPSRSWRTTAPRARKASRASTAACRTPRTRSPGSSAGATRNTCSSQPSRGWYPPADRTACRSSERCSVAGISARSSATRAGGRRTSS